MPDSPTTRFGLAKPVGSDDADVPLYVAGNADLVDELGAMYDQGTLAERPAANTAIEGMIYRASDVGAKGTVYYCDGAAWFPVNGPPPLVTTWPPSSPGDGDVAELLADSAGSYGGPVVWRMRYRAAGGTHKWECVGGPPLTLGNAAPTLSLPDSSWVPMATFPTLPVGVYDFHATCILVNGGSSLASVELAFSSSGSFPVAGQQGLATYLPSADQRIAAITKRMQITSGNLPRLGGFVLGNGVSAGRYDVFVTCVRLAA